MQKPEHLIAGAIALSGALVALAVHQGFKGLAERMAQAPAPPVTVQAARSAPVGLAPEAPAPANPIPADKQAEVWARDRELRIVEQVRSALAAQQQKYMNECFEVPGQGPKMNGPAGMARYQVAFALDSDGKEVSRTFTAEAEPSRVREGCVKQLKMPPIKIEPLGESRTVKVDFSLP